MKIIENIARTVYQQLGAVLLFSFFLWRHICIWDRLAGERYCGSGGRALKKKRNFVGCFAWCFMP